MNLIRNLLKIKHLASWHLSFSATKTTALVVVACFFISSVCRDVSAVAAMPAVDATQYKQIFNDFILPYSYGKINKSHFAGTDRVIINIQDLHCHPKVQKNISNIIEIFDKKYGISNIYLEGAYGNVSTKWLTENVNNNNGKNEILNKILETGKLTGAEYYSATSNKTEIIKGLEKKGPYLDNLKRFGDLLEKQNEVQLILKGIEESTAKVKKQYYTRRQYKIEQLSKEYTEGKIKAEKYYRLLSKHIEKLGIDISKYKNTLYYITLLNLQKKFDYKKITLELQSLLSILKQRLSYTLYKTLLSETDNFKRTDKLYAYILKLSKDYNIAITSLPELNKYFGYVELSQQINPIELLREEERLTREINTRFSDTVAQREVVFLTHFEKYLKQYVSTKITSDDYEYYKENIETYKKLYNKYVDNKVLTLLSPYIEETDKFYEINMNRNEYFADNIFGGIETKKIEGIKEGKDETNKIINNMGETQRVDIIVTGGFHSQTVTEILQNKGVSYIVITPNVSGGVKEAEQTYYEIAKQQKEINFQTLATMIASLNETEQKQLLMLLNPNFEFKSGLSEKDIKEAIENSQELKWIAEQLPATKMLESDDSVKNGDNIEAIKILVEGLLGENVELSNETIKEIIAKNNKEIFSNIKELGKVVKLYKQAKINGAVMVAEEPINNIGETVTGIVVDLLKVFVNEETIAEEQETIKNDEIKSFSEINFESVNVLLRKILGLIRSENESYAIENFLLGEVDIVGSEVGRFRNNAKDLQQYLFKEKSIKELENISKEDLISLLEKNKGKFINNEKIEARIKVLEKKEQRTTEEENELNELKTMRNCFLICKNIWILNKVQETGTIDVKKDLGITEKDNNKKVEIAREAIKTAWNNSFEYFLNENSFSKEKGFDDLRKLFVKGLDDFLGQLENEVKENDLKKELKEVQNKIDKLEQKERKNILDGKVSDELNGLYEQRNEILNGKNGLRKSIYNKTGENASMALSEQTHQNNYFLPLWENNISKRVVSLKAEDKGSELIDPRMFDATVLMPGEKTAADAAIRANKVLYYAGYWDKNGNINNESIAYKIKHGTEPNESYKIKIKDLKKYNVNSWSDLKSFYDVVGKDISDAACKSLFNAENTVICNTLQCSWEYLITSAFLNYEDNVKRSNFLVGKQVDGNVSILIAIQYYLKNKDNHKYSSNEQKAWEMALIIHACWSVNNSWEELAYLLFPEFVENLKFKVGDRYLPFDEIKKDNDQYVGTMENNFGKDAINEAAEKSVRFLDSDILIALLEQSKLDLGLSEDDMQELIDIFKGGRSLFDGKKQDINKEIPETKTIFNGQEIKIENVQQEFNEISEENPSQISKLKEKAKQIFQFKNTSKQKEQPITTSTLEQKPSNVLDEEDNEISQLRKKLKRLSFADIDDKLIDNILYSEENKENKIKALENIIELCNKAEEMETFLSGRLIKCFKLNPSLIATIQFSKLKKDNIANSIIKRDKRSDGEYSGLDAVKTKNTLMEIRNNQYVNLDELIEIQNEYLTKNGISEKDINKFIEDKKTPKEKTEMLDELFMLTQSVEQLKALLKETGSNGAIDDEFIDIILSDKKDEREKKLVLVKTIKLCEAAENADFWFPEKISSIFKENLFLAKTLNFSQLTQEDIRTVVQRKEDDSSSEFKERAKAALIKIRNNQYSDSNSLIKAQKKYLIENGISEKDINKFIEDKKTPEEKVEVLDDLFMLTQNVEELKSKLKKIGSNSIDNEFINIILLNETDKKLALLNAIKLCETAKNVGFWFPEEITSIFKENSFLANTLSFSQLTQEDIDSVVRGTKGLSSSRFKESAKAALTKIRNNQYPDLESLIKEYKAYLVNMRINKYANRQTNEKELDELLKDRNTYEEQINTLDFLAVHALDLQQDLEQLGRKIGVDKKAIENILENEETEIGRKVALLNVASVFDNIPDDQKQNLKNIFNYKPVLIKTLKFSQITEEEILNIKNTELRTGYELRDILIGIKEEQLNNKFSGDTNKIKIFELTEQLKIKDNTKTNEDIDNMLVGKTDEEKIKELENLIIIEEKKQKLQELPEEYRMSEKGINDIIENSENKEQAAKTLSTELFKRQTKILSNNSNWKEKTISIDRFQFLSEEEKMKAMKAVDNIFYIKTKSFFYKTGEYARDILQVEEVPLYMFDLSDEFEVQIVVDMLNNLTNGDYDYSRISISFIQEGYRKGYCSSNEDVIKFMHYLAYKFKEIEKESGQIQAIQRRTGLKHYEIVTRIVENELEKIHKIHKKTGLSFSKYLQVREQLEKYIKNNISNLDETSRSELIDNLLLTGKYNNFNIILKDYPEFLPFFTLLENSGSVGYNDKVQKMEYLLNLFYEKEKNKEKIQVLYELNSDKDLGEKIFNVLRFMDYQSFEDFIGFFSELNTQDKGKITNLLKVVLLSSFDTNSRGMGFYNISAINNCFALRLFLNEDFRNHFKNQYFNKDSMENKEGISISKLEEIKYNINEGDSIENEDKVLPVLYYMLTGEQTTDISIIKNYFKTDGLKPFNTLKKSVTDLTPEQIDILIDSGLLVLRYSEDIQLYERAVSFNKQAVKWIKEAKKQREQGYGNNNSITSVDELMNPKNKNILNGLIDIFFSGNLSDEVLDRDIMNGKAIVVGYANNQMTDDNLGSGMFAGGGTVIFTDGDNRHVFTLTVPQLLAEFFGVKNENINLYRVVRKDVGERVGEKADGFEFVEDREALLSKISEDTKNGLRAQYKEKNPLFYVFGGHGVSVSVNENTHLRGVLTEHKQNTQDDLIGAKDILSDFIDFDNNNPIFLKDNEGNEIRDLSNVIIDLSSCHSSELVEEIIKAFSDFKDKNGNGFEKLPIFLAESSDETPYGISMKYIYVNGKKISIGSMHLALLNTIQDMVLNGEEVDSITIRTALKAFDHASESQFTVIATDDIISNSNKMAVNLLLASSDLDLDMSALSNSASNMSVFSPLYKKWMAKGGIKAWIANKANAYKWEDVVFKTIPALLAIGLGSMGLLPVGIGIFIGFQVLFLFSHTIVKWLVEKDPDGNRKSFTKLAKEGLKNLSIPVVISTTIYVLSFAAAFFIIPAVFPFLAVPSMAIVTQILSALTATIFSADFHRGWNKYIEYINNNSILSIGNKTDKNEAAKVSTNSLEEILNLVNTLTDLSSDLLTEKINEYEQVVVVKNKTTELETWAKENNIKLVTLDIVKQALNERGGQAILQDEGGNILLKFKVTNGTIKVFSKQGTTLSEQKIKQALSAAMKAQNVNLLVFADKETNIEGVMKEFENERKNSVIKPEVESIGDLTKSSKITREVCENEQKATGVNIFKITQQQAQDNKDIIEILRKEDFKFVVVYDYKNIPEKTLLDGIVVDTMGASTKEVTDVLKQLSKKASMDKINKVEIGKEIAEEFKEINIFEKYGVIPEVSAENIDLIKGKVSAKEITKDNYKKVLDNPNVIGVTIDEESKSLFSEIKGLFKAKTSAYSKGMNLGLRQEMTQGEKICDIEKLADILTGDRSIANINIEDLGLRDSDRAYIEYLMDKGKIEEANGYIRGLAMNQARQLTSFENFDNDKFMKEANGRYEIGFLTLIVQLRISGLSDKDIQELLKTADNEIWNVSAEEYYEMIGKRSFELLQKIINENEKVVKRINKEDLARAKEDLKEINTLLQDRFRNEKIYKGGADISTIAIRSMLSAA